MSQSAQWRSGAVAQWRSGAVAQWRSGAVAQWRSGAVAQWRSGAVAQCVERRVRILSSSIESWPNCFCSFNCNNEYVCFIAVVVV